jgi:hypothetical protein
VQWLSRHFSGQKMISEMSVNISKRNEMIMSMKKKSIVSKVSKATAKAQARSENLKNMKISLEENLSKGERRRKCRKEMKISKKYEKRKYHRLGGSESGGNEARNINMHGESMAKKENLE